MKGVSAETMKSVLFLVLRQCYVEHLNCGEVALALDVLRKEISALDVDKCRDQIPTRTMLELTGHRNKVSFVQFSNNGEFLASSSIDCTIIWQVQELGSWSYSALKHILYGHEDAVSFIAWSPDDTKLLTWGNTDVLKLWDVKTGKCKHTFGLRGFIVSSCAWFPDSKQFVCGSSGHEKGICMWYCDGNEIKAWRWQGTRTPKVVDLAVTPNGKSDKPLRFMGHKQHERAIRSCFGGWNSKFIASGSEDSHVYIWNCRNSKPIEVLSGHTMTVNCVSWNPKRLKMLASASDDCTIRIWGSNSINYKRKLHELDQMSYTNCTLKFQALV